MAIIDFIDYRARNRTMNDYAIRHLNYWGQKRPAELRQTTDEHPHFMRGIQLTKFPLQQLLQFLAP